MANRTWERVKAQYCDHVGCEVFFEAEVIYPAEWLPEIPPRVIAHRCSNGLLCNFDGRANCVWSGTNPLIDPFTESL